jgi:S-adenosylmethionine:tRNA ribosyltransferase-isomerase
MKLSKFTFDLPEALIAQTPSKERDESKLMVVHRDTGKIENKKFKNILDYFDDGDVMVLNNTKVFNAAFMDARRKLAPALRCLCFVN